MKLRLGYYKEHLLDTLNIEMENFEKTLKAALQANQAIDPENTCFRFAVMG